MLLLATDTSGKFGSLALAQCDPDGACRVLEVVSIEGGTFSAQLIPQLAALLARHRFDHHQIDAFAAASGPGSFTGLRVGLAAIKAMAEVSGKPIAAVSVLEAVAMMGASRGRVMAALDAGRGEIYSGEYELSGQPRKISERVLTPEQFLAEAKALPIVTPVKTITDLARSAGLQVEQISAPDAGDIARLGWQKLQRGDTISPEDLDANYVRRSDAEIFAKLK